jgi:phosphohistidine phosphatase SixA
MKNLKLFILTILFSFLLFSCTENKSDQKVVYLVRHAEKDLLDTTDNPALTKEGVERSNLLVETLKGIDIDRFYSTIYQRNVNTLKPLAEIYKKEIQIYEWHDWKPMLEDIKKSKQQNFIICGHGDNLLPMISYLGGVKPMKKLGHEEYDNLFKLIISHDTSLVEVIKY